MLKYALRIRDQHWTVFIREGQFTIGKNYLTETVKQAGMDSKFLPNCRYQVQPGSPDLNCLVTISAQFMDLAPRLPRN